MTQLPSELARSPTSLHRDQSSSVLSGDHLATCTQQANRLRSLPHLFIETVEGLFHREKRKNNYLFCMGAHLWTYRFGADGHGKMGDAGVRNPRTVGTAEDPAVLTPANSVQHRGARGLPRT